MLAANLSAQQPLKRPNILWISTEDMSPHLGCYGDRVAKTPNIDRLASQGIRYTNVFTTAAISAPVRAGIITGMYQTSIGCMHMRTTSYRRSVDNPIAVHCCASSLCKSFHRIYESLRILLHKQYQRLIISSQKIRFRQASGMNAAIRRITGTDRIKASLSLQSSTGLEHMKARTGISQM